MIMYFMILEVLLIKVYIRIYQSFALTCYQKLILLHLSCPFPIKNTVTPFLMLLQVYPWKIRKGRKSLILCLKTSCLGQLVKMASHFLLKKQFLESLKITTHVTRWLHMEGTNCWGFGSSLCLPRRTHSHVPVRLPQLWYVNKCIFYFWFSKEI